MHKLKPHATDSFNTLKLGFCDFEVANVILKIMLTLCSSMSSTCISFHKRVLVLHDPFHYTTACFLQRTERDQ